MRGRNCVTVFFIKCRGIWNSYIQLHMLGLEIVSHYDSLIYEIRLHSGGGEGSWAFRGPHSLPLLKKLCHMWHNFIECLAKLLRMFLYTNMKLLCEQHNFIFSCEVIFMTQLHFPGDIVIHSIEYSKYRYSSLPRLGAIVRRQACENI